MGEIRDFLAAPKDDPLICQQRDCEARAASLRLVAERDKGNVYKVKCAQGHIVTVLVPEEDIILLATWSTLEEHVGVTPEDFPRGANY